MSIFIKTMLLENKTKNDEKKGSRSKENRMEEILK